MLLFGHPVFLPDHSPNRVPKDSAGMQANDLPCFKSTVFPLADNPSILGDCQGNVSLKNQHFPKEASLSNPGDFQRVDHIEHLSRKYTLAPWSQNEAAMSYPPCENTQRFQVKTASACLSAHNSISLNIHKQSRHPSHSVAALTFTKFIYSSNSASWQPWTL